MFSQNLLDFIHDDITWCAESECTYTECERNLANKRQKTGLFSAALFKGTELCPLENQINNFREGKELHEQ